MTTSTFYAMHQLATSNEALTQHETTLLRAQVEELERQRARFSQNPTMEVSHVHSVANQVDALKTIVAPVRRLPPEILGEVFLWMPTSEARPRNYQNTVANVTLVCRSWRDAALSAPRLWCDVWVRVDSPSLSFDTICAWVARAGSIGRRLEVSSSECGGIRKRGRADDEEDTHVCAGNACRFANPVLVKLLKSTAFDWYSVTLNCPAPECLQRIVAGLKDYEPQPGRADWSGVVQSFAVGAMCWSHWPAIDTEDLFSFIPSSVTSLTLHLPSSMNGFEWDDGEWKSPLGIPAALLEGLISLELSFGIFSDISSSSIFNSLQHCTNLETLTMDFAYSAISPPESDTAEIRFTKKEIILPKLRCLSLPRFNGAYFDAFKLLKIPALQTLIMSLDMDEAVHKMGEHGPVPYSMRSGWDEALDAKELIDFVRGDQDSDSQLCFLHIKALSLYPNVLFHLLRDLRSLVHIKLEWMELCSNRLDDSFTNLITHSPPSLPNLKTIELLNLKHAPDFEIPSLRSFVKERDIDWTVSYHDHKAALEEKKSDDKKHHFFSGYDSDEKYWNPEGALWWD